MELWQCLPNEGNVDTVGTHLVKAWLGMDSIFQKRPDKSYIIGERYKARVCLNRMKSVKVLRLEVSGQNDLSVGYFRKVGTKQEYVLDERKAHLIGIRKALVEGKSVSDRIKCYYEEHKKAIGE
jgi:hypothetical protein